MSHYCDNVPDDDVLEHDDGCTCNCNTCYSIRGDVCGGPSPRGREASKPKSTDVPPCGIGKDQGSGIAM